VFCAMSKLSGPLKALINAPHARPGPVAPSKRIATVFNAIARDAASKGVGLPAWLSISTAATMTMNSPESLLELHRIATATSDQSQKVSAAELMREVGLKCISFNGIPRSINCLGAFHTGLAPAISSAMSRTPSRNLTESSLKSRLSHGIGLWKSIYHPFDEKLTAKLGQSHPDLPIHIHESHYAALLSNPPNTSNTSASNPDQQPPSQRVGRILTSLVGISCLRAQTGVGPQVLSHVFGLRKAYEDGSYEADGEQVEGGKWLASDEGSIWILETVDRIVDALGEGGGTTFAPGLKAKL
jgi:hypothetical protein